MDRGEDVPLPPDPGKPTLRPGATLTLITGERYLVLEEYSEVMEKLSESDSFDEKIEFQTFRDFGTPGSPDNEPYRVATDRRCVISVTEITDHLYDRHQEAIKKELEERPVAGVTIFELGGGRGR